MVEENSLADFEARMVADTFWLRAEFFRIALVVTAREVAVLAAIPGEAACEVVDQWRTGGQILSIRRDSEDLYPAFQFGTGARPLPIISEILGILRQFKARSDWDNAFWFNAPNG